jgi:hypothetical protein
LPDNGLMPKNTAMTKGQRILLLLSVLGVGLVMSSPGLAQAAVEIPEPTDVTLLALAVAGLVIGRQVAKRRKD